MEQRKSEITWTTSLTIPDEFEKRDEFILALQDFLNFGYSAYGYAEINIPQFNQEWRDIYMFYYENSEEIKYAREMFFIAYGLKYINNKISPSLFTDSFRMANPISMADMPEGLGCGMFNLPLCEKEIFCNCIGTVIIVLLVERYNVMSSMETIIKNLNEYDDYQLNSFFKGL